MNRCRYSFRWQWPVRNRHYIFSFQIWVRWWCWDIWLVFRSHLAFSFLVFHSVFHLVSAMYWIDLFWADFILVMLEVAAAFAAWSACSFPSMFMWPGTHSVWMLQIGLTSCILSIVSRILSILYCPDYCFWWFDCFYSPIDYLWRYRLSGILESFLRIIWLLFKLPLVLLHIYCGYCLCRCIRFWWSWLWASVADVSAIAWSMCIYYQVLCWDLLKSLLMSFCCFFLRYRESILLWWLIIPTIEVVYMR